MRKTNEKGFTLIEILVVIAILGILAVVTIVALNPVKRFQDARNSRRREDVNAILQAISVYSIDNEGAFPTIGGAALQTLTIAQGAATCGAAGACDATDLDGLDPYISTIPNDPQGADYLVGVDDAADPQHIIVGTNDMEINDDQTASLFYLTY